MLPKRLIVSQWLLWSTSTTDNRTSSCFFNGINILYADAGRGYWPCGHPKELYLKKGSSRFSPIRDIRDDTAQEDYRDFSCFGFIISMNYIFFSAFQPQQNPNLFQVANVGHFFPFLPVLKAFSTSGNIFIQIRKNTVTSMVSIIDHIRRCRHDDSLSAPPSSQSGTLCWCLHFFGI